MTDLPEEQEIVERRIAPDMAVVELVDATRQLTQAVEGTERKRKRDRVVYLTLLVVLLLVSVPSSIAAISGAITARAVHNTQKVTRETGDQIKDCLDPSGLCYKRSQANLAQAVASVVDANHNGKLDSEEILSDLEQILARLSNPTH